MAQPLSYNCILFIISQVSSSSCGQLTKSMWHVLLAIVTQSAQKYLLSSGKFQSPDYPWPIAFIPLQTLLWLVFLPPACYMVGSYLVAIWVTALIMWGCLRGRYLFILIYTLLYTYLYIYFSFWLHRQLVLRRFSTT